MPSMPWKYRWDHQGALHRTCVKGANKLLSLVPYGAKYNVAVPFKARALPYRLVEGGVAVQVGAPYDTLASGRSRAAHLGMAIGKGGTLVVVEPFERSCERFEAFASKYLSCDTVVINAGAWSEAGELELQVDESHPATNFSAGLVPYDDDRLKAFHSVKVRSDTLDALVDEARCGLPDLVSITTNWAEREILEGTKRLRAKGLPYIALALGAENEDYRTEMDRLGYDFIGYEDRGATFALKPDE